tara:strand:- start:231 stop:473 length:243 start_codon:yes stop_codon:yes gene_type:complete
MRAGSKTTRNHSGHAYTQKSIDVKHLKASVTNINAINRFFAFFGLALRIKKAKKIRKMPDNILKMANKCQYPRKDPSTRR